MIFSDLASVHGRVVIEKAAPGVGHPAATGEYKYQSDAGVFLTPTTSWLST
jgi:hypothetical protein